MKIINAILLMLFAMTMAVMADTETDDMHEPDKDVEDTFHLRHDRDLMQDNNNNGMNDRGTRGAACKNDNECRGNLVCRQKTCERKRTRSNCKAIDRDCNHDRACCGNLICKKDNKGNGYCRKK